VVGSSWPAQSVLYSRSCPRRAKLVVGHGRDDTRDEDDSSGCIQNCKRVAIYYRRVKSDEAGDEATTPSSERLDVPFLCEQVLYRRDVPETDENLRKDIGTPSVAGQKSVGNDHANAAKIPLFERLEAYIAIPPDDSRKEHNHNRDDIHRVENAGAKIVLLCDCVRCKTQSCPKKEDNPRRERRAYLSLPNLVRIPTGKRHHHESDEPHADFFHCGILLSLFGCQCAISKRPSFGHCKYNKFALFCQVQQKIAISGVPRLLICLIEKFSFPQSKPPIRF